MRIKQLLTKSLLVAAGLCMGANSVWGGSTTLYSQDYQSADATDWTSPNYQSGLLIVTDGDNKYHKWTNDGQNNRNAYNWFANDLSFTNYTEYTFSVKFCIGALPKNDGSKNLSEWVIAGKNSSYTANSAHSSTSNYYLVLAQKTYGSAEYTVQVGSTTLDNAITLEVGTWYILTQTISASSVTTVITDGETEKLNNVNPVGYSTIGHLKGINLLAGRYYGEQYIDDIQITANVDEEIVSNPTIDVAYAGSNRTVTITGGTSSESNAVTTYYTTDGSDPTSSSEVYSSNLDISSDCTIKAISISSEGNASEIVSQTVTVGKLTLATPTISATGFTNTDGTKVSNPTFNFACDNSSVLGTPTATLTYTFTPEGGSESAATEATSYTPGQYGTLKVIASAEGYDPSEKTLTVSSVYTVSYTGRDYATATHEDTFTTWGEGYSVSWDGWASGLTAYLSSAAISDDNHLNVQNAGTISLVEGWGLVRGDQKSYGYRARYAKEGNFIALKENTSKGSDATLTAYQTVYCSSGTGKAQDLLTINAPGGYVVQQLYQYSPARPSLTDGDAVRLTFKNATAGTGTAYGENFKIDFYNSSSEKVANVRADWWDDVANTNGLYTYGYTYSSDGGTTADNSNVWETYMNDMTNAAVDLTMSYSGGNLYVIGTMTNGKKVYYVNYKKEGLEGDLTYNLYGNNATLSNITTTAASVTTTPVHPTNVAVTLGTNGYTTYANNVYPLDLTNAKAYKAAVDGNAVKFTLFEQAVPAGTGMLVEGQGTVNLPIADASADVSGNEFFVNASGNTFNADANTTYYAMIKDSNPLKFGTFDPSKLQFPATKAYLKVATGAGAKALTAFFGGEVTGISQVENAAQKTDDSVYNIAGQRVSKPTKGLYIVNGKKVMVK